MEITIKDVIEKLKDKDNISISLIQRDMAVGFVKASSLFKELLDKGYLVLTNGKYAFDKDKFQDVKEETPSLKIIFLDIDGVLNCRSTKDRCGPYTGIEDDKVKLLKGLVDATGAKIVLISTWKEQWYQQPMFKNKQDDLAKYLDEKFKQAGLTISGKVEDIFNPYERGQSIIEYIRFLHISYGVNVSNFIIFDDELFDYKRTKLTKNLIQTSYKQNGLEKKHIRKAIERLC